MTLSSFLKQEGIFEYALLPFGSCRVTNRNLFDRMFAEKEPRAVLIMALPYYVKGVVPNVSRYAVARDYHVYVKDLSRRAKEACREVICAAADHSPIDERHAACVSGLGVLGENGLVLHKTLGSFFFLCELYLSDFPQDIPLASKQRVAGCSSCGACRAACPTGACGGDMTRCLSRISQKKQLTDAEEALLRESGVIWGCDVCQEVCPYNREGKETPISFFRENLVECLDDAALEKMLESGEFLLRAYAWRGEKVIKRNLSFAAQKQEND